MTLEGCVVKFADTIAYIGRDLQDAQEVGLIHDMNNIPPECKEIFGTDNRAIIDTLIHDLLDNSDADEEGFITYSPIGGTRACDPPGILPGTDIQQPETDRGTGKDQDHVPHPFFNVSCRMLKQITVTRKYLRNLPVRRGSTGTTSQSTPPAGLVRDFIAGMTDRYFLKRFEECVIPHRVEGSFP